MTSFKLFRTSSLLIFFLALLVRFTVLTFHYDSPIPPDGVDYNRLAISLWQGDGYVSPVGHPTSERPPLYPVFLAAIFSLFGYGLLSVKVIQALIDSGTCALIFLLSKKVFNEKVGRISGVLSIFHLSFLLAATTLLVETLLTFLVVLAVYHFIEVVDDSFMKNQVILGGILGLAALTRGTLIIFPLFVLIPLLWSKEPNLMHAFKQWIVILASFSMTIGPWALRNYRIHHQLVPIATQAGYVFYSSYKPPQGKVFGVYTIDETVTYARSNLSEAAASDFLFKETLRYIADNPRVLWYLSFLKLGYFFSPFDWEILGGDGVYNFSYAFIFPFSLWGIYISLGRREGLILALPIIHSLFVSFLFYGSPRLRLSVEPFFIIFASLALSSIFENRRERAGAVAMLMMILFASNLALYLFSNDIKSFAASMLRDLGLW